MIFLLQKKKRECCPLLVCKRSKHGCTHTQSELLAKTYVGEDVTVSDSAAGTFCSRWFVQRDWTWIRSQGRETKRKGKHVTPAWIPTPHKTGFICVWRNRCCLPLVVSVYVYFYHSTEHFRPQRPHTQHRKELTPSITDDIIKLLNETAVLVVEGLFSGMGLYNKITLWADARAGGSLLYPNRTTHPGSQRRPTAVCVWVIARFLHATYFKIPFFPPHCHFLNLRSRERLCLRFFLFNAILWRSPGSLSLDKKGCFLVITGSFILFCWTKTKGWFVAIRRSFITRKWLHGINKSGIWHTHAAQWMIWTFNEPVRDYSSEMSIQCR